MMDPNGNKAMNDRFKITFFFTLIAAGVALRLLCQDIPNFAPVAALALFAGFVFQSWIYAAMVPVAVLAITNIYLGGYDDWLVMLSVYACLILPTVFGKRFLQSDKNEIAPVLPVIGFSFAGSLMFFFVTNYAAWLSPWYPNTWSGFIECYVAALPFFRYTLMGDLFFCFAFFGAHALVVRFSSAKVWRPVLN